MTGLPSQDFVKEGVPVRIAARIAAALIFATLSSVAPAAALTIGPPPPTGSSQATVRAYYEARLARQGASYESQLADLRKQLAAVKKRGTAADKTIADLKAQLKSARSSVTSEQVSALTSENEALKSKNATLLQTRAEQNDQVAELEARVQSPLHVDAMVWIVLVFGLGVGALVGLRIGFKRAQDQFLP